MICQNCGFQNNGTSKFCIKCGTVIAQQSINSANNQQPSVQLNNNFGNSTSEFMNSGQVQSQPTQRPAVTEFKTQTTSSSQSYQSTGSLNFIFFILAVLLKPITSIKEELHKFNDTKTSMLFAGLISGAATVISLIKTIFSYVYIPASTGFYGYGATEAHWAWDNLKNLKWGEVIFKNFLLYAGILLAIALVYYLASLIIKKNASFQRLLGIASISVIPIIICSLVISPLVAKLYAPLGIVTSVIGTVYTIILLLDGVNRELSFEDDDIKIYTNLACLSILGSVGYYVFMKFFFTIATGIGGLDNLLDLFK